MIDSSRNPERIIRQNPSIESSIADWNSLCPTEDKRAIYNPINTRINPETYCDALINDYENSDHTPEAHNAYQNKQIQDAIKSVLEFIKKHPLENVERASDIDKKIDTITIVASAISTQIGADSFEKFGTPNPNNNEALESVSRQEFGDKQFHDEVELNELNNYKLSVSKPEFIKKYYDGLAEHKGLALNELKTNYHKKYDSEKLSQLSGEQLNEMALKLLPRKNKQESPETSELEEKYEALVQAQDSAQKAKLLSELAQLKASDFFASLGALDAYGNRHRATEKKRVNILTELSDEDFAGIHLEDLRQCATSYGIESFESKFKQENGPKASLKQSDEARKQRKLYYLEKIREAHNAANEDKSNEPKGLYLNSARYNETNYLMSDRKLEKNELSAELAEIKNLFLDPSNDPENAFTKEDGEQFNIAALTEFANALQLNGDSLNFNEKELEVDQLLKGARSGNDYIEQAKIESARKLELRYKLFGEAFDHNAKIGSSLVNTILYRYINESGAYPESGRSIDIKDINPTQLKNWIYDKDGYASKDFLRALHDALKSEKQQKQEREAKSGESEQDYNINQIVADRVNEGNRLLDNYNQRHQSKAKAETDASTPAKTESLEPRSGKECDSLAERATKLHFDKEKFSQKIVDGTYPSPLVKSIDKLVFNQEVTKDLDTKQNSEAIEGRSDLIYVMAANPDQLADSASKITDLLLSRRLDLNSQIVLGPCAHSTKKDALDQKTILLKSIKAELDKRFESENINPENQAAINSLCTKLAENCHTDSEKGERINFNYTGKADIKNAPRLNNGAEINWSNAIVIGNDFQKARAVMLASKLGCPLKPEHPANTDEWPKFQFLQSENEGNSHNSTEAPWWQDKISCAAAIQETELIGRSLANGGISIYDPSDYKNNNITSAPICSNEFPKNISPETSFNNYILQEGRKTGKIAEAITDLTFQGEELRNLKKSDAVLVLGNRKHFGMMSHVLKLFEAHKINKNTPIYLSGYRSKFGIATEAEVLIKVAVNFFGADPEQFILDTRASNTPQNFDNFKKIVSEQAAEQNKESDDPFVNFNNITVVGQSFQMSRARGYAAKYGFPQEKTQFYGAYGIDSDDVRAENWYKDRQRLRSVDEIKRIGEYTLKGDLDLVTL